MSILKMHHGLMSGVKKSQDVVYDILDVDFSDYQISPGPYGTNALYMKNKASGLYDFQCYQSNAVLPNENFVINQDNSLTISNTKIGDLGAGDYRIFDSGKVEDVVKSGEDLSFEVKIRYDLYGGSSSPWGGIILTSVTPWGIIYPYCPYFNLWNSTRGSGIYYDSSNVSYLNSDYTQRFTDRNSRFCVYKDYNSKNFFETTTYGRDPSDVVISEQEIAHVFTRNGEHKVFIDGALVATAHTDVWTNNSAIHIREIELHPTTTITIKHMKMFSGNRSNGNSYPDF